MKRRVSHSAEPDSSEAAGGVRESRSMRHVNRSMRAVSGSFALSDPIAFFCECKSATCYSPVWLSAADFDAIESSGSGWFLEEGHEPSAAWPAAEARSFGPTTLVIPLPVGRREERLGGGEAA